MPTFEQGVLSLEECAELPTETLQQAADQDFDALVDIAVADAVRDDMRETTRAWLRSPEQIELWVDALRWAETSLQSSVEWKMLQRDKRRHSTARLEKAVRVRLSEAQALLKRHRREQLERSPEYQGETDPDHKAGVWLARYFREEAQALRETMAVQRGLPQATPIASERPKHWGEFLEIAHARGAIFVDVSDEVQRIRELPDADFDRLAHQDATSSREPMAALRHPLVLHRWECALRRLAETTQAGDVRSLALTRVSRAELAAMPDDVAADLIKRRRRFKEYARRVHECKLLARPILAAARERVDERERPWKTLVADVRGEIARRHPEEFAFIRDALADALDAIEDQFGSRRKMSSRDAAALRTKLFDALDRRAT